MRTLLLALCLALSGCQHLLSSSQECDEREIADTETREQCLRDLRARRFEAGFNRK